MFLRPIIILVCLSFLAACQEKGHDAATDKYPWEVTVLPGGNSQVFGIRFYETTLAEAKQKLGRRPDIALFENKDGHLSVEVYYKEFDRGGLSANLLLTLAQDDALFERLKQQAVGHKRGESGVIKYALSDTGLRQVDTRPISGLTYVPYANLDEEMVSKRFGEPAHKIRTHEQAQHWLYPEKGLDLIINAEGKEILQFVPPLEFERLARPLQP